MEFRDAEELGESENILKDQRAGVQADRHLYAQCQYNVQNAEPQLRGTVIAQTDELRDGRNAAAQIFRRCP